MKFLWRASIRQVGEALYLVAQNLQSAQAQVAAHPQVAPTDVTMMQRIDPWDQAQNMTILHWPEPPPPPEPNDLIIP